MYLVDVVRKQLQLHPVLLYLRGTPDVPADDATRRLVEALRVTGLPFSHVDVNFNSEIGRAVQKLSGESCFPQLFIAARFVGPVECVMAMARNDGLREAMKKALDDAHLSACAGAAW